MLLVVNTGLKCCFPRAYKVNPYLATCLAHPFLKNNSDQCCHVLAYVGEFACMPVCTWFSSEENEEEAPMRHSFSVEDLLDEVEKICYDASGTSKVSHKYLCTLPRLEN